MGECQVRREDRLCSRTWHSPAAPGFLTSQHNPSLTHVLWTLFWKKKILVMVSFKCHAAAISVSHNALQGASLWRPPLTKGPILSSFPVWSRMKWQAFRWVTGSTLSQDSWILTGFLLSSQHNLQRWFCLNILWFIICDLYFVINIFGPKYLWSFLHLKSTRRILFIISIY